MTSKIDHNEKMQEMFTCFAHSFQNMKEHCQHIPSREDALCQRLQRSRVFLRGRAARAGERILRRSGLYCALLVCMNTYFSVPTVFNNMSETSPVDNRHRKAATTVSRSVCQSCSQTYTSCTPTWFNICIRSV